MGSEVFKLKSLYMDDTVVRGARIGLKNARTTKTIVVNSYEDPQIKTGETGINNEYLVQASLKANDLKGYGTFTDKSAVVSSYSGPQDLKYGDVIRLDYEAVYYTVTGIQGTDILLTDKYAKPDSTTPPVQSGPCTVRKIKIYSVNFESVANETGQSNFSYSKDNTAWVAADGVKFSDPVTVTGMYPFATGMQIEFQAGALNSAPDLMSVNTVYKTLVDNNTTPVSDVSLSPLPYPHESLKVFYAPKGGTSQQWVEEENYLINYSQNPDVRYPRPPYEEREVAYIKFLDRLTDEPQVDAIGTTFEGSIPVIRKTIQPGGVNLPKSVKNIIAASEFVIKVKDDRKVTNEDYVVDYDAGIVTFVKHRNSEGLIDSIIYPKSLIWDGVSVLRGTGKDAVQDEKNLVIPPISGISGVTGMVYYEDVEQNALIRDVDYIIDPESGAIRLNTPLKDTESVLMSYYVEGEDVSGEYVLLTDMRVNKYPLIYSSLTLVQNYIVVEDGQNVNRTKVLIEGTDFEISYFTGKIKLLTLSSTETIVSLQASYTPLAPINCILQSVPGDDIKYRMTIVEDILEVKDAANLLFTIDNPSVSIPKEKMFDSEITDSNYEYQNTIIEGSLLSLKEKDRTYGYAVGGYRYDDTTRELQLETSIQESRPDQDAIIVATYSFESETLPYAPMQVFFPIYAAGQDNFLIEGFDRTDVLKKGMVLRIDNFDPEMTYYFKLKEITYDGENTRVYLSGAFPEQVVRPTFYLLDDDIQWSTLPTGVVVDRSAQINAESITLQGNMLEIRRKLKTNCLLMVDGEQIYTVKGVSIVGTTATVSIFPYLMSTISSGVQYSNLPVYTEQDTLLAPEYPVLTDPVQPAFTLSYNPPAGFDGGAKILIDTESVVLFESVAGVKNPEPYRYEIKDYSSVYALAKAIQATFSTFKDNFPDMSVPDYAPFTISTSEGVENYYLSDGTWSADLIIPFEEDEPLDIPYTVNIIPEMFHWTLLRTYKDNQFFTVEKRDRTDIFSKGNLLAFKDKIDNQYYYFEVANVELTDNASDNTLKDSKVNLTDAFRLNLLDSRLFKYSTPEWDVVSNPIADVIMDTSTIVLSGVLRSNVKVGSFLKIADKYIYKVRDLSFADDLTSVVVAPSLDSRVKAESYYGYIKTTLYPIYLDEPGRQPYLSIQYTAPKGHVGTAEVQVASDKLIIREVIDNFYHKSSTLKFSSYDNFSKLVAAINLLPSYVAGKKPYVAEMVGELGTDALRDAFEQYRLEITTGYLPLSCSLAVGVSAFSVEYTAPTGYVGRGQIRVEPEEILIREVVENFDGDKDGIKVTSIVYATTKDLQDIISNVIPSIPSLVPGDFKPFSTIALNPEFFGEGYWSSTFIAPTYESYEDMPQLVYGRIVEASWQELDRLDETRFVPDTDYTIENGAITLTTGILARDRYRLNYMGLWDLGEYEGGSILCTCKFITELPVGSRLDVQMDYLNIDQFFLQKCTERKFSEIVVIPQIGELLEQSSSGGQGSDSGANNNTVPNYTGGLVDLYYLLRDEEIKKQLFVRFFQWYKDRLRNLSAELQLGLGFKFAHSNAAGLDSNGQYTLDDAYVETADYTLTSDDDLKQITNGNSKFFPVKYEEPDPVFYPRFTDEYLSFNEVFCCNVSWTDSGTKVTRGYVKSERPYWKKESDLVFKVWADGYLHPNLVGYYNVDVSSEDRSFEPGTYTFLRTVQEGDSIKVQGKKNYYKIATISSPTNQTYEYMTLSAPFKEKGVRTYDLDKINTKRARKGKPAILFDEFMNSLPPDGRRVYIKRQSPETFPMFDDYGSLGSTAYGDDIDGHITDTRRIKKPFGKSFLALFGLPEDPKIFKVWVKKDSEVDYEPLLNGDGSPTLIDLSKMTFKEERNVDDVMDALRFDFTEKGTLPPFIPGALPKTIYDTTEDSTKGLHRDFYLSFERVYNPDASDPSGYYQGIVLRCKHREWWFKITDEDTTGVPTIEDYGFNEDIEYRNFYDPQNIYKRLLLEKQAWETEELIVKDLYDFSDKLSRAFDQGDLSHTNLDGTTSVFQGYLARPDKGTVEGISDILRVRIPAYEKQLRFLIDTAGPVFGTLYPDRVHAEDAASPEIALTYQQTLTAWNIYNGSYAKMLFYMGLNDQNNFTWKNDYVKWSLSLEKGLIYQKDAKQMYESGSRHITVGRREIPALQITLPVGTVFKVEDAMVTVSSNYTGKYLRIDFSVVVLSDPINKTEGLDVSFNLYDTMTVDGITSVVYKTLGKISQEISDYQYTPGQHLFSCKNVFEHYENSTLCQLTVVPQYPETSGMPIDPDVGATLTVTSVADHRQSDSRVLYLGRGIEDRIYTHGVREVPGFSLKYLGQYYEQSLNGPAIGINVEAYDPRHSRIEVSYGTFLNGAGKKSFVIKILYRTVTFSSGYNPAQGDGQGQGDGAIVLSEPVEHLYPFELFNEATQEYFTIAELGYNINIFNFSPIAHVRASLLYDRSPYGDLSSEYFWESTEFTDIVIEPPGVFNGIVYAHVNTTLDAIPAEINQAVYRIYYDTNFKKKLDIKFDEVIKNGSSTEIVEKGTPTIFTFNFQDASGTYKTLDQFTNELNTFVYNQERLFEAVALYTNKSPYTRLSTRFVVTEDVYKFIGFDQSDTIYVDTYVESITPDSASDRDVANKQNAYFSFPFYTANGNPNKVPIEGIPVAGTWDPIVKDGVLELECLDGVEWTIGFNDYSEGDYKSYKPKQSTLDKISNNEVLTQEEFNSLGPVLDQPVTFILKELVLSEAGSDPLKINLRQHSTISELADAINAARFNDEGHVDSNGKRQFFFARGLGDPDVQGTYKSYEVDATYVPIIAEVRVTEDGVTKYYSNKFVGWEIKSVTLSAADKHTLQTAVRRYSPADTYGFTMKTPQEAYTDTLRNNPQGFRRDTLAFDVFCWDDDGRYEVKDNWIYFSSASVVYDINADLGQPDRTLGIGVPLAGSGHIQAPDHESLADLMNRINSNGVISRWFYVNLKFTRRSWLDSTKDIANPGFFEYDYLPNYKASVPKSKLDDFYLMDDEVMSVQPGSGYRFTASSCVVDDALDTMTLGCTWEKDYGYEASYDLSAFGYSTIAGLASKINAAVAPTFAGSVFEARVVGNRAATPSTDMFFNQGAIAEVSEVFVVSGGGRLKIVRSDWKVNDVVRVTSDGTLPTPLVAGVDYYVVSNSLLRLGVSATPGGAALFVTGGVGTHTVIRRYVNFSVSIAETFTVDTSANRLLVTDTDWDVNDPVWLSTTGTLPAVTLQPLVAGTTYYVTSKTVVSPTDVRLRISRTLGGTTINITGYGTGVHTVHSRDTTALQIRVRDTIGPNFTISAPTFYVSPNASEMLLKCTIGYTDTFLPTVLDISSQTLGILADSISNLFDYTDVGFGALFVATLKHSSFDVREASRLLDHSSTIGTVLSARLNDIVAMKMLNMTANATVSSSATSLTAQTYKIIRSTSSDRDLHTWIDGDLRGDYKAGLVSIELVPFKIPSVPYGFISNTFQQILTPDNVPAHGYFGVMGDINWLQVSDHNLHIQLNYIKERLGKPWRDSAGDIQYDYYTPENYNENNPYAIDLANFLGYLRTTRYNQIKNSIINEAVVQNKYLWLYLKFHKEFGCDQKVIALQKQIEKQKTNSTILQ